MKQLAYIMDVVIAMHTYAIKSDGQKYNQKGIRGKTMNIITNEWLDEHDVPPHMYDAMRKFLLKQKIKESTLNTFHIDTLCYLRDEYEKKKDV